MRACRPSLSRARLVPDFQTPVWFCTTDNKPYDVIVTAILTAAARDNPGTLRSDGHWKNWTAGIALYETQYSP